MWWRDVAFRCWREFWRCTKNTVLLLFEKVYLSASFCGAAVVISGNARRTQRSSHLKTFLIRKSAELKTRGPAMLDKRQVRDIQNQFSLYESLWGWEPSFWNLQVTHFCVIQKRFPLRQSLRSTDISRRFVLRFVESYSYFYQTRIVFGNCFALFCFYFCCKKFLRLHILQKYYLSLKHFNIFKILLLRFQEIDLNSFHSLSQDTEHGSWFFQIILEFVHIMFCIDFKNYTCSVSLFNLYFLFNFKYTRTLKPRRGIR